MTGNRLHSLGIPPDVLKSATNLELVRFWVADGRCHIAMNFSTQETQEDDAYMCGNMLADIMQHFINAHLQASPNGLSGDDLFKHVNDGLFDGLSRNRDLQGNIGGGLPN